MSLDSQISSGQGTCGILGQILISQPDGLEPAMAAYQKAVELLEAVTREHPELADQAYHLAMFLGDLSSVQQTAGKLDSALASTQKAIEILERLDRQYPGVLNYQGGLGSAYNMMSDLHRRRREPAESLAFAQKARRCSNGWSPSTRRTLFPRSTWPRAITTSAGCSSKRASPSRHCDRSSAPLTSTRACPTSTRATATTWRVTSHCASP